MSLSPGESGLVPPPELLFPPQALASGEALQEGWLLAVFVHKLLRNCILMGQKRSCGSNGKDVCFVASKGP